jgi:hypothetical protein
LPWAAQLAQLFDKSQQWVSQVPQVKGQNAVM